MTILSTLRRTHLLGWILLVGFSSGLFIHGSLRGDEETDSLPQLGEIIEVIRQHLPDITQEDLDRAALQGILTEFQSRLEIVPNPADEPDDSPTTPALTQFYEASIGYLASPTINGTALESIRRGYNQLESENILQGLILDLRNVSGTDYQALTGIVGLFTSEALPLIDWGTGVQSATPQSIQISPPVVALIDETTQGAGETLAALIREAKLGLLVGRRTAGEVHSYEQVPLDSGQTLKLATGKILTASGRTMGTDGIAPDISVSHQQPRTSPPPAGEENESSEPEDTRDADPTYQPLPNNDPILTRAHELLIGINIVEKRSKAQ